LGAKSVQLVVGFDQRAVEPQLLHGLVSLVQNALPAKLVRPVVRVLQPLVHLEYSAEHEVLFDPQPQQLGVRYTQQATVHLDLARPPALSFREEGLAELAAWLLPCGSVVGAIRRHEGTLLPFR
jgi:hypothetical protein